VWCAFVPSLAGPLNLREWVKNGRPPTGAVAGIFFGPAGPAVGLVARGTADGPSESEHVPRLHDAFIDDVRAEVPEKSSAVLLLASPEHGDAMVSAFEHRGGRLVRHHRSPEAAKALEGAVAGSPPATGG
jgi:uncharacterized membrane protein